MLPAICWAARSTVTLGVQPALWPRQRAQLALVGYWLAQPRMQEQQASWLLAVLCWQRVVRLLTAALAR